MNKVDGLACATKRHHRNQGVRYHFDPVIDPAAIRLGKDLLGAVHAVGWLDVVIYEKTKRDGEVVRIGDQSLRVIVTPPALKQSHARITLPCLRERAVVVRQGPESALALVRYNVLAHRVTPPAPRESRSS